MSAKPPTNRLICVTGLPGSGKSFFASRLAKSINADHLNSDRLRNNLGLRGNYSAEAKEIVYNALFEQTKKALIDNQSIVLDSTFYQESVRDLYESLSRSLGVPIVWIAITASEETIRERTEKQRPYSEADFEVYQSIKAKFENLKHIDLSLDSDSDSVEEMVDQTMAHLGMLTTAIIKGIIQRQAFADTSKETKLIETHASWVILTDNFAFKIKKPVHFSFMDFSTLEKRKFYCDQEITLNRRFTSGVYLDVQAIRKTPEGLVIGAETGEIIDYAVRLKRLDEDIRMENLLQKGEIQASGIRSIAKQLVEFHKNAPVLKKEWNLVVAQMDFFDIKKVRPFIHKHFGRKYGEIFDKILFQANQFLKRGGYRFQERVDLGFVRDGHGDLHSGNIFMYPEPILFDCIEFNAHFRQLDLLDELAFLCMDLEFYGKEEQAKNLIETYESLAPLRVDPIDEFIFLYFKMYRANVRLKVTVLQHSENPSADQLIRIKTYLDLLDKYSKQFH